MRVDIVSHQFIICMNYRMPAWTQNTSLTNISQDVIFMGLYSLPLKESIEFGYFGRIVWFHFIDSWAWFLKVYLKVLRVEPAMPLA